MLQNLRSKTKLKSIFERSFFQILLGSILICQAAFHNGFPLVYSDTGTYIFSGMDLTIPIDRPIFYGLFLRFTSLQTSLWLTIFVQSYIVSFTIYAVIYQFFTRSKNLIFIIICLILSFMTSLSWYSSQLMPDIFTALSILLFFLLQTSTERSLKYRITLFVLFVLSINMHFSNLLIILGVFLLVAMFKFLTRKKENGIQLTWKISLLSIVCAFLIPFIVNFSIAKTFKVNQGSHVFLTGRMLDNGVLKSFLDDKCVQKKYALCYCKDSLPKNSRNLLWDEDSPLNKLGGWSKSEKALNEQLKGILSSPKHLILFASTSITATFSQLMQNDVGSGLVSDWYALPESPPHYAISTHFHRQSKQYQQARQNSNLWEQGLNLDFVNYVNRILLFFSLFIFCVFLYSTSLRLQLHSTTKTFILIVLIGILMNAFVTGSLANVYDRLQARVSWLFIFATLILLFLHGRSLIEFIKNNKKANIN
jgi:hypothetical protein